MMDCGYWRNQGTGESWLFILAVDEGSRLRVGRVIREGSRAKINADDVKQFLEEQWLSVFGVPSVIRTDAESPCGGSSSMGGSGRRVCCWNMYLLKPTGRSVQLREACNLPKTLCGSFPVSMLTCLVVSSFAGPSGPRIIVTCT